LSNVVAPQAAAAAAGAQTAAAAIHAAAIHAANRLQHGIDDAPLVGDLYALGADSSVVESHVDGGSPPRD
jgi:hypothetical protein